MKIIKVKRYECATDMIEKYNLPLTEKQIVKAFKTLSSCIENLKNMNNYGFTTTTLISIVTELPEINRNIFIALILRLCTTNSCFMIIFVLGCDIKSYPLLVQDLFPLLDNYDFNINHLDVSDEVKENFIKVRNAKYGGNYVKGALKH